MDSHYRYRGGHDATRTHPTQRTAVVHPEPAPVDPPGYTLTLRRTLAAVVVLVTRFGEDAWTYGVAAFSAGEARRDALRWCELDAIHRPSRN